MQARTRAVTPSRNLLARAACLRRDALRRKAHGLLPHRRSGPFRLALGLGKRFVAISPERGAATTVYLASSPEIATESGGYFEKCRKTTPSVAAQDDRAGRRLWAASAQLAGLPEEGLR